jgi:hypothetical protein
MHFTGKKVRQNIGSDRERDRMKKIFNLCGKTRWRICINLYLDLKHLTFRESTNNLFPCLNGKKLWSVFALRNTDCTALEVFSALLTAVTSKPKLRISVCKALLYLDKLKSDFG